MSKHTPGPWTYELNDDIGIWMIGCKDDDNFASVYIIVEDDPAGVPLYEANAHLIAASPDLLDACEAVVNWWEENENDGQVVPPHVQACMAAIKKAKT